MKTSDIDFFLPPELIASEALSDRSASRMLRVDRMAAAYSDMQFTELPELLRPTDVLVLNDTKVFPARIFGKTEDDGNVEVFLVEDMGENIWQVLARPAKRLKIGRRIIFSSELSAKVANKTDDGKVLIRFETVGNVEQIIDKIGKTPLPPYIKREREEPDLDRERYQTIYAKNRGAIAAPTAGLHFTPEIIDAIKAKSISVATITLHVGYGTFEPIRVDDLSDHRVLPERFSISEETADLLNSARREGRRIVAVGTTTTRTLESSISKHGWFKAESGLADLTVTPGYDFKAVDAMLTNFHLPKSSLLILVSTFAGRELIMKAYEHAVKERYRFYSYGDCMFIE
jgi:S-adenosylmethionine:tRNA ribosyltransferase-isomerase